MTGLGSRFVSTDTDARGQDGAAGADGADGVMASVVAGDGIAVDATDPANPIVTAAFSGALVVNTGAQTIFTKAALTWNSEDYDTDSWHDNGVNPTRLTVPAGVAFVRLAGGIFDSSSVTGQFNVVLSKNGSEVFNGGMTNEIESAGGDGASICSPVLAVIAGDYFELNAFATVSRTSNADGRTFFSIERMG